MRQNVDKVDEKCFVFSVIASRTPSLFSPETSSFLLKKAVSFFYPQTEKKFFWSTDP